MIVSANAHKGISRARELRGFTRRLETCIAATRMLYTTVTSLSSCKSYNKNSNNKSKKLRVKSNLTLKIRKTAINKTSLLKQVKIQKNRQSKVMSSHLSKVKVRGLTKVIQNKVTQSKASNSKLKKKSRLPEQCKPNGSENLAMSNTKMLKAM